MSFPVRYTCPYCDVVVTLAREGYLADKSVTEDPLTGWEYVPAYDFTDVDDGEPDADGVEFVCGASETEGEGCGNTFYLSFVRYEEGREVPGDAPLRPEDAPNFDFRR
ncbi:hypothetical protein [Halomarina litorea]|uniref:hypothetical protein n=1 Tax=Halomarina litorea TaxID=2961595 RepID=UPI0020C4A1CD|nr:hypothetical protein [Halomarina sp. BCD28]